MSSTVKIGMSNTSKNDQNNPKQSLEEKKALLKNQIQELKQLKDKIKQSLNISTSNLENSKSFSQICNLSQKEIKKTSISSFSIKNELLHFAGMQCVKYSKDEYVFHFVTKGEGGKTYTYSVQFFKIGNSGELGKWVLPTFIDINWILKETPLDNIIYAEQFLRNCKHYIDCYHNRMNQFVTLKKSLEKIANCTIDADRSYKYINIELLGVYDVQLDNLINVIVYLVYDVKEARPQQITIDSLYGARLDRETEKGLKSYLKSFKKFNLSEALENIENGEHPLFSWQRAEKDQTLLEDDDSEEESSLKESIPKRKRLRRSGLRKKNTSEKELKRKNTEGRTTKRKIPATSEIESESETESQEAPTKSKTHVANNNKPSVKTGLIQKRKGKIKPEQVNVDISKFFTKKDKKKIASEAKDSEKSANEESERKNTLEEPRPFKKKSAKSILETIKPSLVQLIPLEQNIKVTKKLNLKRTQRKYPVLENISEHETPEQGRVLRSATNSPKKDASPKKISERETSGVEKVLRSATDLPKKDVSPKKISEHGTSEKGRVLRSATDPPKKDASSKKISEHETLGEERVLRSVTNSPRKNATPKQFPPKKVAPPRTSSKIQISSKTIQANMKQTSLKIQYPNENSPSSGEATIKIDYKAKMLEAKVVTSTPMPFNRKLRNKPPADDLDISEIKFNENPQAAKTKNKRSVRERVKKIHLTRKIQRKVVSKN